jgi:Xaa-Pro aminopeptidase
MIPFDAARLQRLMREHEVDVVLATTRHNVRYLTGGYYFPFYARTPRFGAGRYLSVVGIPAAALDSAFYVGRGDGTLNEQDAIEAFGPFWIATRRWIQRTPNMSAAAAEAAGGVLRGLGLGTGRIGIESSFLPVDAFEALRRELPGASFVNATPLLGDLRAIKRPAEIERLRRAHEIVAQAIRATLAEGRPEQTTREIAAAVQRRIEAQGGTFLYALTNVGPGFARAPSAQPWGRGRALHVDAGAAIDEYGSDIARMGSVGAPSALAMELFEACLRAHDQVRAAVRPGLRCRDLWQCGTEAVKAGRWGGYGRFLAHGLGMVSHEPPEVNDRNDKPLEPGMVVSIEAEYLHPEAGHIKHEDTVVVTPAGREGLGDIAREWCQAPAGPVPVESGTPGA